MKVQLSKTIILMVHNGDMFVEKSTHPTNIIEAPLLVYNGIENTITLIFSGWKCMQIAQEEEGGESSLYAFSSPFFAAFTSRVKESNLGNCCR